MTKILQEYLLSDMIARYEQDEAGHIGLLLYPAACPIKKEAEKRAALDSLIQVKLAGDAYYGAYGAGFTMRNSESTNHLLLDHQEQEIKKDVQIIRTYLKDKRGYLAVHSLIWKQGTPYIRMHTTYKNLSGNPVMLEMLSSFSLQGMTPYTDGDAYDQMQLYRLRSRWSEEGKLEVRSLEELQLNPSWGCCGVRCERFGSIGSMPVNKYFPFAALEDTKAGVFWGVQLESPSSWQIEIYREDENIGFSGGIADREYGHWMKRLEPGEELITPEAIVTTAHTDNIDILTNRLTTAGKEALQSAPKSERELPIIFNEYCTTWGNPSHENITNIVNAIAGKGFTYFVIDCGWYKEPGIPWDVSMGDYQISKELFPDGLEQTIDAIRKAGMKPGIWFEIENAGPKAKAYERYAEHMLKRDGYTLTTSRRRFWDMTDTWVWNYLDEKVLGLLKSYGFAYMKVDYNDEIGIGCDGWESLGEGLRQNMLATYAYFEKIKKELPEIVLENCASGGHRLEPGFMARTSMASFSDAHECLEIPIVAANLHRAILPQQSQIWAVIRKPDSLKRIAWSVINTFLGRMCLSGDVTELTDLQWQVIEKGIAFYKQIVPIIRDGQSYIFTEGIEYLHHPDGWQVVVRIGEDMQAAYITIHVFGKVHGGEIQVPLPSGCPRQMKEIYSDTKELIRIQNGVLCYHPRETEKAVAVYLA